jgi:hypothetical protein
MLMFLCLDATCWASHFSMTTSFWTYYIQNRSGKEQEKKDHYTVWLFQASTSFLYLKVSPYCSDICMTKWHLLTQWQELIIWWDQLWHAAHFNLSNNRTISECVKQFTDVGTVSFQTLYHWCTVIQHQLLTYGNHRFQVSAICMHMENMGRPQRMVS